MPVFDATALLYFLEPDAPAPLDPVTNAPLTNAKRRIDFLIKTLEDRHEPIVIPTPVLSEVLVHVDAAGSQYLHILNSTRCFRVVSFDQRATVELAAMTRDALSAGDLRSGLETTRAKLKFDRQIVAIARTQEQTTIYSDDGNIAKLAEPLDINVIRIHELPLPPQDRQELLAFDGGDND